MKYNTAVEITDEQLRTSVLDYFKEKYRENPLRDFGAGEVAVAVHAENPTYDLNKLTAAIIFLCDHGKLTKRTLPRGDVYYRLSGETVNEISPSQYAQQPLSSMTINNYGIFVNGANTGQINQNTKEVFEILDKLVNIITTAEVESTKKMELVANAETIRAQITSPTPNADIVRSAWNVVNNATIFGASAVTVAPILTELATKLGHLL